MQVTLDLKIAGSALTGSVSQPGREGNTMETPITDGKVDGNNISFTVKREFNGNSFVTTYKGALDGDNLNSRSAGRRAMAARGRTTPSPSGPSKTPKGNDASLPSFRPLRQGGGFCRC